MPMGPVQILVVGFPEPKFTGAVLAELDRLKENDIVRLVDLVVVRKRGDGTLERVAHSDLTPEEAAEFGAIAGSLVGLGAGDLDEARAAAVGEPIVLDESNSWYVDDAIPPGSAAAVAIIEHRWAIGLRDAILDAGGMHLADAWVHPADLVAVGLLQAEEAAAR
jgi:hypothetical protein